jgi:tetratricopeptide (TPR) repeat protein
VENYRRQKTPAEASNALAAALLKLRKDDTPALAQAVVLFGQLAEAYPSFLEAKADRLLVLALQFDDVRVEEARLRTEAEEKARLKAKIETSKSLADWQSRANALSEEIDGVHRRVSFQAKQESDLKKQMTRLLEQIEAVKREENLSVLRARAVMLGVTGDTQVIPLAERYHNFGGTDGWATIALAEYAVNTRVPPDTLTQVRSEVEKLRQADPIFMRAHVLAARLDMVQRKFDQAAETLEAVVAMNPSHELAVSLRGQAQRHVARAHP